MQPLVLDLDNDGVETTHLKEGAYFDHGSDGFAEQTGWAAADDGILVMDRNGDGIINDGKELFADQTILKNGTKAAHGFAALAEWDENTDGKIDSADTIWSRLAVWQDIDGDGYAAPDEVYSLDDIGIKAITLGYTNTNLPDANGNTVAHQGTFIRTDDTTGTMANFSFQRDLVHTIATDYLDVPDAIASLPDIQGYGTVYDLHQAMVRDT
ncbi:MAG: calcium-binding protein, partial [candidate division WOR-3 bacterium]